MKILLLTQVVPYPPDSGPKIKTYNVLRYLARRHEVHLVSFARSAKETASARELEQICASVTTVPLRRSRLRDAAYLIRSFVSGRPFLIERDDSAPMHRAVADLARRLDFDAVHADQLSMAQYAIDLPIPLRVLDEHNAVWTIVQRAASRDSFLPRRLLANLEWRKLRAYEGGVCRRFDRVTVVSDEDRRGLELAAGAPLTAAVIPIAVDTDALAFRPRQDDARHVVSVATMFYPPNAEGVLWFARDVFPRIRQRLTDVEFIVVGSRPPPSIRELAKPGTGVVVTGYVADLEPIFRRAAVTVVPLNAGSGMRVKILEAFSRGIPVVSTSVGVEGIDARPGEHLVVADDVESFARGVIDVIEDDALAGRLAGAARNLVVDRYDWRNALAGLDAIYPSPMASERYATRVASEETATCANADDVSAFRPVHDSRGPSTIVTGN